MHVDGNDNDPVLAAELTSCYLCGDPTPNEHFCDTCKPQTCYKCNASHVAITNSNTIKCSNGCEYSFAEYTRHRVITSIYNDDPIETLRFAGNRVEMIIPKNTPVTVHETIPNNVPDDHVLGTHYTTDKESVLENGIEYPPRTLNDKYFREHRDSVRTHALFAWPHTPDYTEAVFSFDFDFHDIVYIEVPREAVRVSSYRFLDWTIDTGEDTHAVPPDRYDSDLVFTADELVEAVTTYRKPIRPTHLLWDI